MAEIETKRSEKKIKDSIKKAPGLILHRWLTWDFCCSLFLCLQHH